MKNRFSSVLIAFAFVFGIMAMASTTTNAQWNNRNNGIYNQEVQQGYQYGVNTGASDAQHRQSYSPQRSHYYQRASSQAFRDGFVRGYDQGYRQYSANNGGYYPNNNGGYYPNNGGYPTNNGGYYPGRNDGSYGGNNQQLNAGYQQGLNTGASDGQSNKSYSPERSRYYQRASNQAYREGFVRGYDAGYRQYSRNRNYRRSNTAASILGQILGVH